MTISPDRASGAFFLLFGLALYFLIVPASVEQVDGGNLAPETLPNAVSLVIALCGGLLILKPTSQQLPDTRYLIRTAVNAGVLALAIYAMSWFGFEYVGPVLALVLMLMIGERRPLWLIVGAIVMPASIWFFVVQLLDRALP